MLRLLALASLLALPTAAEPPPNSTVSLLAVGDVMLSRGVARKMKAHGIDYPFLKVTELLHSADITFANLECPITKGRVIRSGEMVFHADPGAEAALKHAGFSVLSLANNHLPDFGPKGVLNTLAALDSVGIAHAGAGRDDVQAGAPAILVRKGLRFAFLAYNDQSVVPMRYDAAPHHPGTNIINADHVRAAVQAARKVADIVIVSMHSGWEYRRANPYQKAFAHAAIDAGADLVIGHHPHVLQRVERYKGKLILYSLGNFVFDQTQRPSVMRTVAARLTFTRSGVQSLQFIPLQIEHGCQPRIVTSKSLARRIFERLRVRLSKDGTLDLAPKLVAKRL